MCPINTSKPVNILRGWALASCSEALHLLRHVCVVTELLWQLSRKLNSALIVMTPRVLSL